MGKCLKSLPYSSLNISHGSQNKNAKKYLNFNIFYQGSVKDADDENYGASEVHVETDDCKS